MQIAVATIDVISSSKLVSGELEEVMGRLNHEVELLHKKDKIAYYEIFRGDSMQVIIPKPEYALQIAFMLKSAVNSIKQNEITERGKKITYDIRIALGLGETKQTSLQKMTNEPPFIRSGKRLDHIESKNRTMGITTGVESADRELNTELFLYEGILKRWTVPVAEVVYHKLNGKTEQVIANELQISQSAVNQRSHSAYWNGLDALLTRYREITQEMTS